MMGTLVLFHFGLVALLAAGALLATRVLRMPELGHLLWLLVFVRLIVPPFVEVPLLPADRTHAVSDAALQPESPLTMAGIAWQPNLDPIAAMPAGAATPTGLSFDATTFWVALWCAGAFLYAGIVVLSTIRFQRSLRGSAAAPSDLSEAMQVSARQLGLDRTPRLLIVDRAISPAMWPTCPATMLLPRDVLSQLSTQELRAVILHELVHFKRRDHWVRGLEMLVLCVYWWLPVVWWFRRELRMAEEACCDRRVIRAMEGDATAYAQALIKTVAVLSKLGSPRLPRVATGASAIKPLRRRITMIMQYKPARTLSRFGHLLLCGGALAALPLLPTPMQSDDAATDPPEVLDPAELSINLRAQEPTPINLIPWQLVEPIVIAFDPPDGETDPGTGPTIEPDEHAALQAARDLIAAGDLEAALQVLQERRAADDLSPAASSMLASALMQLGRMEEAAAVYENALVRNPPHAASLRNLGVIYAQLGRQGEALQLLSRAVALDDGDAKTYAMLGQTLANMGDYAAAESAYHIAQSLDPAEPNYAMGLLHTYFNLGRVDEALALSEHLLQHQPENASLLLLHANMLTKLGRQEEAAATLKRVDQLDGTSASTLNTLRQYYLRLNRDAAAVGAYHPPTALDPEAAVPPTLNAVNEYLNPGESQETRRLLEYYTSLNQDRTDPANQKAAIDAYARIAQSEGNLDSARELLERSIAIDPDDGETLLRLGSHYARMGEYEKAGALYDRAAAIDPYAADAYVQHAQMLATQERYDDAMALLQRAQELEPSEDVNNHLLQLIQIGGGYRAVLVPEDPEAQDETPPAEPIVIVVTARGEVCHGTRDLGVDGVHAFISRMVKDRDVDVTVEADAAAASGVLVRVIDECKRAGARVLSVKTRQPDDVCDVSDLDARPRVIKETSPAMTNELRSRMPAVVNIVAIVDTRGSVESASVQSSSDEAFNEAALDAARGWEFEPGQRKGTPVRFRIRIPVKFIGDGGA